jgi:hypothetical protein
MTPQESITLISKRYPELKFKLSSNFYWDPRTITINYPNPIAYQHSDLSFNTKLLHELSHGILGHSSYSSDLNLIKIESAAWALSFQLPKELSIPASKKVYQKAIYSYLDWMLSRSSCPECKKGGLQYKQTTFFCLNCKNAWSVGSSRFKRPYRTSKIT